MSMFQNLQQSSHKRHPAFSMPSARTPRLQPPVRWQARALAAVLGMACGRALALDEPIAPPPGLYYIAELLDYRVDSYRGPVNGEKLPGDNHGRAQGLLNRFLWMTGYKVLGADHGMEFMLPVARTSLGFSLADYRASSTGFSDIYLSPLVLGWHGPRWDALAGLGLWLDNGRSGSPADPGAGYRRLVLSAGANLYLDEQRRFSLGGLLRHERSERGRSGPRHGDQLSLDWTAQRRWGLLQAGLGGYSRWEGLGAEHSITHAVGGQLSYFLPSSKAMLRAGFYREFSVEAGGSIKPQGHLLRLMFAKAF